MTKQELQKLFNKAVKGLASQKFRRSYRDGEGCLYRGPRGKRCAIGWLIPDSRYSEGLENKTANVPAVRRAALGTPRRERVGFKLRDLQTCHDIAATPSGMRQLLRDFAERNGLKIPKELGKGRRQA